MSTPHCDGPPPDGTGALPPGLDASVTAEIARAVERVPTGVSCVATGSLIEGLGNPSSDIDLYLVPPVGDSAGNPVAIGIRQFRYVDCEYLSVGQIGELAVRFATVAPAERGGLTARDFVRYYRLATGVRLRTDPATAALLDRCTVERHLELFAPWSRDRAAGYLARARVAAATDAPRQRTALLREAALWRATAVLAEAGEGYPSLKWVTTKAARRFGAGSEEYRGCLYGYGVTAATADATTEFLAAELGPPPGESPAGWRLAEGVGALTLDGRHHLVRGQRTIARITGAAGPLVAALARTGDWTKALAETADAWSLAPADVLATATPDLGALTRAGYLVPLTPTPRTPGTTPNGEE
jgi:hypothetical protein